jgi:hypothetical protein
MGDSPLLSTNFTLPDESLAKLPSATNPSPAEPSAAASHLRPRHMLPPFAACPALTLWRQRPVDTSILHHYFVSQFTIIH